MWNALTPYKVRRKAMVAVRQRSMVQRDEVTDSKASCEIDSYGALLFHGKSGQVKTVLLVT